MAKMLVLVSVCALLALYAQAARVMPAGAAGGLSIVTALPATRARALLQQGNAVAPKTNTMVVQIKSKSGACMTLADAKNGSVPFNQPCNPSDSRQIWIVELDDVTGYAVFQSAKGTCLSVTDATPNVLLYGSPCTRDQRQQWAIVADDGETGTLQSKMGPCAAVYDGNDNSRAYTWGCLPADPRQRWTLATLEPVEVGPLQLKSKMGSCVATDHAGLVAFGAACSPTDTAQQWFYYPQFGLVRSAEANTCLALRPRTIVGDACQPAGDESQQWNLPASDAATPAQICARTGNNCMALYDGNSGSLLYGWATIPADPRQQWSVVTLQN